METEEKIELLIAKSFAGRISRVENDELDAWVCASEDNFRHYQELKNLWQVVNPAFSPDTIDVADAEEKIMEQINKRRFMGSSFSIWWQRAAAVLILPTVALLGYLMYQRHPNFNDATAFQEISSPFGVVSKIDLPDASVVWLNSGSKLKYPLVFASNERKVFLSGEGYFKVESDKTHPFIVATEELTIKATGTQFNVEAYAKDTITAITLLEGNLAVNSLGGIDKQLKPNQRLILNSKTKTYGTLDTDAKFWGVWKEGILAFRDQPLDEVFKRIGRTYNVNIQVKDPTIGTQLFKATFEGESLDEILRLLKLSSPIQYKRAERSKLPNGEYDKELIEVYRSK
jgi:transmembrane sensor